MRSNGFQACRQWRWRARATYEIGIELSEERLRQFNLSLSQVPDAVKQSNPDLAAGAIRTEGEEIRVRTIGRKYTGGEFADIVVVARPNGDSITVGRQAAIKDGFIEEPTSMRLNGRNAIGLTILKTPEEDALKISKAVNESVERRRQELPEGARISVLRARINLLVKNGILGLSIVFLLLWLFLDLRRSFWAGKGMLITGAGALFILWATGLVAGGILKFEVFPQIDGFIITGTVEFSNGTPVSITNQAVGGMEEAVNRVAGRMETPSGEPMVEHILSLAGGTLEEIPRYGPQFGSVQVILLPSERRGIHSDKLLVEWQKEIGNTPAWRQSHSRACRPECRARRSKDGFRARR